MFEVTRVKNDFTTVIDDLGIMNEDELIDFARNYIGDDQSKYGTIFTDEKEILDDIEWIKTNGDVLWFETEDTNVRIKFIDKGE